MESLCADVPLIICSSTHCPWFLWTSLSLQLVQLSFYHLLITGKANVTTCTGSTCSTGQWAIQLQACMLMLRHNLTRILYPIANSLRTAELCKLAKTLRSATHSLTNNQKWAGILPSACAISVSIDSDLQRKCDTQYMQTAVRRRVQPRRLLFS